MAAARTEGGGVKVNSSSVTMTKSLRKRMVVAHSEAGVKAAMCSGAGDKVVACSRVEIMDGRWRQWHDGF
jgi:hypothetical protein